MNTQAAPSASDIWTVISKEITGIQLLWEAVEGMYFKQPLRTGLATFDEDAPLLFRIMQTALMESLLMRMSRLMDPHKSTGKPNLSLEQLTRADPQFCSAASGVREAWGTSKLKDTRDKYLSHNDLVRSLNEAHTLSIPLSSDEIEAMRGLVAALRSFRRVVSQKFSGNPYLDQTLDKQVCREINVLDRTLAGGQVLLPTTATACLPARGVCGH